MDETRTIYAANPDAQSSGDAPPLLQTLDAHAFWSRCHETRLSGLDTPQRVNTESSIEAYDIEISAAVNAVSALRYRRNRLLPIFRLPSELLLRVVRECAGFHSTCTIVVLSESWIPLSHVCKALRDLALGYPVLWTNITTQLGWRWCQESLKRSHGTLHGLHVHAGIDSQFIEGLRHHMDTIERFSIEANSPIDSETVTSLLACSIPNLREAVLRGVVCSQADRTSPNILRSTPLLQHLSIVNFDIAWTPLIWPNLHSLKVDLSRLRVDVSFVESFADIVDCLFASPALECLELLHCLPPPSRPTDLSPKVALPRLSTLIIYDAFDAGLAVLETIEAPHLVKLDLQLFSPVLVTDAQGEKIANVLKAYKPPLHTALLEPAWDGYRISAWNHLLARSDDGATSRFLPWNQLKTSNKAAVCIELKADITSETVAVICEALPLADLQGLSIKMPYDFRNRGNAKGWDRHIWQSILLRAHRLQFFRVTDSLHRENTSVLYRLLATPSPYENSIAYLPLLKNLTLGQIRLAKKCMGSPFYRKLLQFLHRRAGLGAGIHTLRLEDCSEAARALDESFLRVPGLTAVEHVGDGTWDTNCRIDERDLEACMGDGPGDAIQEDALYSW